MFTIYKGTQRCVQPGSKKGPQRSWLKAKLNPTPPPPHPTPAALLQLKKPVPPGHLPLIQAFGSHRALWEIEGLGSNLVLLLVQQVLLASCCYVLGFHLQTMKEGIRFEINLSLGPSFEGKAWERWQQLTHGHQRLLPWVYNGNPCDPYP